jgi:hypothetical protein
VQDLRMHGGEALPDGAESGCAHRGPGDRELRVDGRHANPLHESAVRGRGEEETVTRAEIILERAQAELLLHGFGTFVDDPPAIAQGGKGVVVSGCPHCRKRMQSLNQFMTHLADDVLPKILEAATGLRTREPGEEG